MGLGTIFGVHNPKTTKKKGYANLHNPVFCVILEARAESNNAYIADIFFMVLLGVYWFYLKEKCLCLKSSVSKLNQFIGKAGFCNGFCFNSQYPLMFDESLLEYSHTCLFTYFGADNK